MKQKICYVFIFVVTTLYLLLSSISFADEIQMQNENKEIISTVKIIEQGKNEITNLPENFVKKVNGETKLKKILKYIKEHKILMYSTAFVGLLLSGFSIFKACLSGNGINLSNNEINWADACSFNKNDCDENFKSAIFETGTGNIPAFFLSQFPSIENVRIENAESINEYAFESSNVKTIYIAKELVNMLTTILKSKNISHKFEIKTFD